MHADPRDDAQPFRTSSPPQGTCWFERQPSSGDSARNQRLAVHVLWNDALLDTVYLAPGQALRSRDVLGERGDDTPAVAFGVDHRVILPDDAFALPPRARYRVPFGPLALALEPVAWAPRAPRRRPDRAMLAALGATIALVSAVLALALGAARRPVLDRAPPLAWVLAHIASAQRNAPAHRAAQHATPPPDRSRRMPRTAFEHDAPQAQGDRAFLVPVGANANEWRAHVPFDLPTEPVEFRGIAHRVRVDSATQFDAVPPVTRFELRATASPERRSFVVGLPARVALPFDDGEALAVSLASREVGDGTYSDMPTAVVRDASGHVRLAVMAIPRFEDALSDVHVAYPLDGWTVETVSTEPSIRATSRCAVPLATRVWHGARFAHSGADRWSRLSAVDGEWLVQATATMQGPCGGASSADVAGTLTLVRLR